MRTPLPPSHLDNFAAVEAASAADILSRIAEIEANDEWYYERQPTQQEWYTLQRELMWRRKKILGCCGDCIEHPQHRWCNLLWHDCQSYTPQIAVCDLVSYEKLLEEVSALCPS